MTLRFFRLLACQLLLVFACATAQAADGIDITLAKIEVTDEGYRLGANYSFELNHDLEDALQHGVKLYFTTEIELTRPRWWWRDDRAVSSKRTVSISYDVLLRQYYVSMGGSVQSSRAVITSCKSVTFSLRCSRAEVSVMGMVSISPA